VKQTFAVSLNARTEASRLSGDQALAAVAKDITELAAVIRDAINGAGKDIEALWRGAATLLDPVRGELVREGGRS
jgi:hypothetical protein